MKSCVIAVLLGQIGVATTAEPLPDLGVVLNLDGDDAYRHDQLADSEAALRDEIDRYADVGLGTIVYSLGAGSEIMLYPTQVADTWGWRSTSYDDDPKWAGRIARNRANMQAGGDAIRTAGERARQRGLHFFVSLRMNDAHYAFGKPPQDYPLAGRFYLENPGLVLGESPIRSRPQYGQLLDFAHPEVRQHRLDQIVEATERYADLMHGIELDFTRFQVFFRPGEAERGMSLMTDLVRQTRRHLDALQQQTGHSYWLIARVPPTPESCAWAGLDIEAWAREGLVDLLAPSLMMTTGFEIPVDAFREAVSGSGVAIYPTLMPRVGWRWPAMEDGYVDPIDSHTRDLSLPQLRAAALNMNALGADGLYLFNFQHYPLWRGYANDGLAGQTISQLSDAEALARHDLAFTVAKANWQDHEGTYENRKALPRPLAGGENADVALLVGIEPQQLADAVLTLRLGLRGITTEQTATVQLNGATVFDGQIASAAKMTHGPDRPDDLAKMLLDLEVTPAALRGGENSVSVAFGNGNATWTDLELLVDRPESPVVVREAPANESSLVRLPDDRLVLFYTDMDRSQVLTISSDDDGRTWSEPRVEFETGRTHHGIYAFLDRSGAIHVLYLDKHGKGKVNVDYTINVLHRVRPSGATDWSDPTVAFEGYTGALRGGLELASGRLLVPIGAWNHPDDTVEPDTGKNHITFVVSDDGGQTWRRLAVRLTTPVFEGYNGANYGAVEPSIVPLGDGRLWLMIRTQTGFMYESFSNDGEAWSAPQPSRFYASNSPAAMATLDDGRLVLLWNNSEMPPRHEGQGVYGGRDALTAAISSDHGKTWRGYREVYRDPTRHETPPRRGDRGTAYPTAVQAGDGKLVVVTGQGEHVRRLLRVDPAWLEAGHAYDDFADGLSQWHTFTEFGPAERWWRDRMLGASVVEIDSGNGKALLLDQPEASDGDGAVWNFPAAKSGRMELRLRVAEEASTEGNIALADRFFNPTDTRGEDEAVFTLSLGHIDRIAAGEWVTLTLTWDDEQCTVGLDGQALATIAAQHASANGPCYLRLRHTAGEPGARGWQVERVAMQRLHASTD